MRKLFTSLLLLLPTIAAAGGSLIKPRAASPVLQPLYRKLALNAPLFLIQEVCSPSVSCMVGGGTGGGGGSGCVPAGAAGEVLQSNGAGACQSEPAFSYDAANNELTTGEYIVSTDGTGINPSMRRSSTQGLYFTGTGSTATLGIVGGDVFLVANGTTDQFEISVAGHGLSLTGYATGGWSLPSPNSIRIEGASDPAVGTASSCSYGGNGISCEGTTADTNETLIRFADPVGDTTTFQFPALTNATRDIVSASSGTATPSANCSPSELYYETDAAKLWACTTTNTWTDAMSGGGGITGTLTATRVPFADSASSVVDDADMTFATDTLTVTNVQSPVSGNLLIGTNGLSISQQTASTPDQVVLATGTTNNSIIIAEEGDKNCAFNHAAQTHPTMFFHSNACSTTQFGSITHNGSDFAIFPGSGMFLTLGGPVAVNGRMDINETWAIDAGGAFASAASDTLMGFSNNTSPIVGTCDTCWTREGQAILQTLSDSATPQNWIYKGADGSGTNIVGANVTYAAGRSTGTAAGGQTILQRSPTVQASGTSQNALVDAYRIVSQAKTLTDAAATTFLQIGGLGALDSAGGEIQFTVRSADASNVQALSGAMYWTFVNTTAGAGGETCGAGLVGTSVTSVSAGTLSCTVATTTGTDVCNLQLNCDTSLTATTHQVYYIVTSNSRTATITPQ